MLKIRVTVNGKVEHEQELAHDLVIGRKAPADVVVADGLISTRHVRLRPAGDHVLVCDLGSTNGSVIDQGERLAENVDTPLRRGQKLVVGPAVVEIVVTATESDSGFGGSEKTVLANQGQMDTLLVQLARFRAAEPHLVIAAEHKRQAIRITEMDTVVGRDTTESQIAIQHQSVSTRHARFKFEHGRFVVEDLGSANGTFVEGNRVMGPTPLDTQAAVTIGTVECLFVMRAPEAGGSQGAADPHAEVLCEHAVRLGNVSPQQARDALAEHRTSGRTLGELFVGKGWFSPKEWSDLYRQRSVLATLHPAADPMAAVAGGRSKTGLVIAVLVGVAVVLAVGFARGWFGGKVK